MKQSKDYTISAIRMLSTVMVVVLHISQQMEKVNSHLHFVTDWLNLGLVMFFCISGFLYSGRTSWSGPIGRVHGFERTSVL